VPLQRLTAGFFTPIAILPYLGMKDSNEITPLLQYFFQERYFQKSSRHIFFLTLRGFYAIQKQGCENLGKHLLLYN